MKQLIHLLKNDFTLLSRNKIIAVSIVVTVIYMIAFKSISHFGSAEKILILVIFNDPALLGFLFTGVMVLFEKNENTLQVLSIVPLNTSSYILSKTIALSLISVVCCYAMAYAGTGTSFNQLHYFFASIFTTALFTFIGFILVAGVNSFNRFLLRAVGVLIFLSIPFLGYYEVLPRSFFLWMPTQPCIDLFRASFDPNCPVEIIFYGYLALITWLIILYKITLLLFKKNLRG